jgi:histone deacetylase 6
MMFGFITDSHMLLHAPIDEKQEWPEKPERLFVTFQTLSQKGLLHSSKCLVFKGRKSIKRKWLLRVHSEAYLQQLEQFSSMSKKKLENYAKKQDSIQICRKTTVAALYAASSLPRLLKAVMKKQIQHGFCNIRPPGHHARGDRPAGFCFLNNCAIGAKMAREKYGIPKVCIVDFDVHHGDATQETFYSDPSVLFLSIHRYDDGKFYPGYVDAHPSFVGEGKGKGYNVNIAWNQSGAGDLEYMYAFQQVILPILVQYQPNLCFVSAGFDAAKGDPLGGCNVTPKGYSWMIESLKLVCPHLLVALEGGYHLDSLKECVCAVVQSLQQSMKTPLDLPPKNMVQRHAVASIELTKKYLCSYWKFQ